jgi:alginate production protein
VLWAENNLPIDALQQTKIDARVPSLTISQSNRYWQHAKSLVSLDKTNQAVPVLELLTTAKGVPEHIRVSAKNLLADQTTKSPLISSQQQAKIDARVPSLTINQSKRYWRYARSLVLQDNINLATPVLELLATARGVPELIRSSASKLLADQNTKSPLTETEDSGVKYTVEGSVSVSTTVNNDTESENNRKSIVYGGQTSLSSFVQFDERMSGFLEVEIDTNTNGQEDKFIADSSLSLGEAWINLDFSDDDIDRNLTVGTQSIADYRGWLVDSDITLIRYVVSDHSWSFSNGFGLSTDTLSFGMNYEPEDEPDEPWKLKFLSEFQYSSELQHEISLFLLGQYDMGRQIEIGDTVSNDVGDLGNEKILWTGFQARGEFSDDEERPSFGYWADVAVVVGNETIYDFEDNDEETQSVSDQQRMIVNGWAIDLGVSTWTQIMGRPQISLGFASTSIDGDTEDDIDRSFRQTGLQSNDDEISYYGLVLSPELSNLQIVRAAISYPILDNSYLKFLFLDYHQRRADRSLKDSNLDIEFDGINKDIGREVNVILALNEWSSWDLEFSFGAFRAGQAAEPLQERTAYIGSIDVSIDY